MTESDYYLAAGGALVEEFGKVRLPKITLSQPQLLKGRSSVLGRQLALVGILALTSCSGRELPTVRATPYSPTEKRGASDTDNLKLIYDGPNYLTQSLHNAWGGKEGVLSSLDIAPSRVVGCESGQATIDESPVKAPLSGRVIKVGDPKNRQDPSHSMVVIQAGNGESVALVHLVPASLKEGEDIEEGTVIGVPSCESPPGGSTKGVHTHLIYLDQNGNPISPVGKKLGGHTILDNGNLVSTEGAVIEGYAGRGDLDGSQRSNRLDATPKPASQPPILAAPKAPIDQVETIVRQPVELTPVPVRLGTVQPDPAAEINSRVATQVSERVATALAATPTPRSIATPSVDSIVATQVSAQVATVLAGRERPSNTKERAGKRFANEQTEPVREVTIDYDPKVWEADSIAGMLGSREKITDQYGKRPTAQINIVLMHSSIKDSVGEIFETTKGYLEKNRLQVLYDQPHKQITSDGDEAMIVFAKDKDETMSIIQAYFRDKKGSLWQVSYTGNLNSVEASSFLNGMITSVKVKQEEGPLVIQPRSTATSLRVAQPTPNPEIRGAEIRSKFIDYYQSLLNVNVGSIDDTFGRLVVSSTIKKIDKNSNSLNGIVYWQSIGPFSYYRGEGNFVVAGELEFQKGVLYFNPEDLSREERANGLTAKGWSGFDGLSRYDARVTYVTKGQIPIETLRFSDSELNQKKWSEDKIRFWTAEKDGQLQIVPSLRYYKDLVPTFTVPFQVIETSQYTAMGSDSMATRYEGVMASRIRARCRYPVWCNMPFHPDYVNPR